MAIKKRKLERHGKTEEAVEERSDLRKRLVKEKRIKGDVEVIGKEKETLKFVSSGCTTMNLALTNKADSGYPIGRVINIVSDYSVGKCIKNAYVLTEKGMIKIDDLIHDEGIFEKEIFEKEISVASFKNEVKETSHFYKEKVKRTIHVETKSGFDIEGTEKHPIMIYDPIDHSFKMKKLKDISIGEFAVIQKGMQFFPEEPYKFTENELNYKTSSKFSNKQIDLDAPYEMTEDLARFLGYFVANGNFMKDSICISSTKVSIVSDLTHILEDMGIPFSGDKYICCKDFKNFIFNLFDKPSIFKASNKCVPKCILQSNKEHQAAFIQALIDCDSSYDGLAAFEYSTASKELSKQIQMILLNFGVFSSCSTKKVKEYPDNTYYRLVISSLDYKNYNNQFCSLEYDFDYEPKKTMGIIPNFLPVIWQHIKEIKKENGVTKNGKIIGKGIFPRYVPISGKKKLDASYNDIKRFIHLYSQYTDVTEYQELLNYHFLPIVKKEIKDEETFVYDFTVPDGHLFWSNGLISHNTLCACELVNSVWYDFHIAQDKKVKIIYDEPEASFDMGLAEGFNMPLEHIVGLKERMKGYKGTKSGGFKHSKTIEDFVSNFEKEALQDDESYDCIVYILDSLDSISDVREQEHIAKKGIGSQDYGAGKASVLSKFFRTKIQDIHDKNVILFIVSQIRDNINAGIFGKKYKRSGGKALDFYCSQIIWLLEVGKVKSNKGIVQGIEVVVDVSKNKVGERYNKINFNIIHGYGIDNISSMIDFLWDKGGFTKSGSYIIWDNDKKYYRSELGKLADNDESVYNKLKTMCQETWSGMLSEARIERKPKYGGR